MDDPKKKEPNWGTDSESSHLELGTFFGGHFEPDARNLVRAAYSLAPKKNSDTDVISTSTVFFAAVEWGMANDVDPAPPGPLVNLAKLIQDHAFKDYKAAKSEFFRDGEATADPTFDNTSTSGPSKNMERLLALIDEADGRVTAARLLLGILRYVVSTDYKGFFFSNRFGHLGDLRPAHYAAALLRRKPVDLAFEQNNSELSIALRERNVWLCRYVQSVNPHLEERMQPGLTQTWPTAPLKLNYETPDMMPGDAVAIWRSVDSSNFGGPTSRDGIVAWAQVESLPSSDEELITLRLCDIFPDSPIAHDDVLPFIEKAGENWPGEVDLHKLEPQEDQIFRHMFSIAEVEPLAKVPILSDRAETTRDLLDRGPLAFSLASFINTMQDKHFDSGVVIQRPSEAAFVLHIDSPWGGGKTTFANYLTRMLNPEAYEIDPQKLDGKEDSGKWIFTAVADRIETYWPDNWRQRKWIPVEFNAWTHQHVSPPWWDFYQTIRKGYLAKLKWQEWLRHWVSEFCWRIWMPGVRLPFLGLVMLAVLLLYFVFTQSFGGAKVDDQSLKPLVESSEAKGLGFWPLLLSLLAGGSGLAMINSFRNGLQNVIVTASSAVDAENLGDSDPLEKLRSRFVNQMALLSRRTQRPLVVVIDDLDRCEPEYVVELMRGLLTIFNSPYVVYVLLGDKHWIETSFENVHEKMRNPDHRGDISFGARFSEKVIQLSFLLPDVDETTREAYFAYLLTGKSEAADQVEPANAKELIDLVADARKKLASSKKTTEIDAKAEELIELANRKYIGDVKSLNTLKRVIDSEVAMSIASSEDVHENVAHRLMEFRSYLPDNPRRIKRIINMVAIYQGSARALLSIQPGSNEWKQLVLWIILMSENPKMCGFLAREASYADMLLKARKDNRDDLTEAPRVDKETTDELIGYLQNNSSMQVIAGNKGNKLPQLDSAAVKWLVRLTPI